MNRNQLCIFLLISLVFSGCGVPEEEHSELSQQLKGVKDSLTKAHEELDFAAKTVKEKEKKITELEDKIKIIQEQNASFTSKEPELMEQITALQAKFDKVSTQRDALQTSLSEKDEQLKKLPKLEQDLATQKEEISKWKQDYDIMRAANEKLQERLEDMADRPKDEFIFTNSLVRYLQQTKRAENKDFEGRDDLTDEEKATLERNNALLAKSSKELTAEMGDYYAEKGTLEQMSEKYPDFAKKYELILKLRAENPTTPE